MENDPNNPLNLTDAEVKLAMSMGIKFRQVPLPDGYVRMETVYPIKFFYEKGQIRIEEYQPTGTRYIKIPMA